VTTAAVLEGGSVSVVPVPLAHGRRLPKPLPQGRLGVVDHAGVFIAEDQPERLAALIEGFISETVARSEPLSGVTASGMGRR
jgi:pimeloyl-ACP methyl ester carboxylesterase